MTIPFSPRKSGPYTATAGQTLFSYNWLLLAAADMKVYRKRGAAVPALLVLDVDYTVTGVGDANGGNIQLTAGALAGDIILSIGFKLPVRATGFPGWRSIPPGGIDDALNQNIIHVQEISRALSEGIQTEPFTGDRDAGGRRLKNLLPGVEANDALTVGQQGGLQQVLLDQAVAARDAAEGWADASEAFAASIGDDAVNAANSAAAAAGSVSAVAAHAATAAGHAAAAASHVASAAAHVTTAASAAATASGAATTATTAATSATVASGTYATEAAGRAAVADGVVFRAVSATSNNSIDVWQRVNSGSSTLLTSVPSSSSLNAGASLQLFADPFFSIFGADVNAKQQGRLIHSTLYNNRAWVGDYSHSLGVGAWRCSAASAALMGFNTVFPKAVLTDDTVTCAMLVKAAAGTRIYFYARFFSGDPSTFVGAQVFSVNIVATGGEDLIKSPSPQTVPAGATGIACYCEDGSPSGDFNVLAHWVNLNSDVGNRPPVRRSVETEKAQVKSVIDDELSTVWGGLKPKTIVAHSGLTVVVAPTVTSTPARGVAGGISGFADSYDTPGSISFNAVRVPAFARLSTAPAWNKIKVAIRASSTAPAAAGATIVAVGEAYLDREATTVGDVLVLLRDPISGLLKTVTQADLSTKFCIAFNVYQLDGSPGYTGEPLGTVSVLTRLNLSFYITPGMDLETGSYAGYSGNPSMALGLELLTSPTQTTGMAPTAALIAALGLSGAPVLASPLPVAPTLAPRLFGMIGREMNAYLPSAHSGMVERIYDVACTLGKQQNERWTYVPGSTADNVAFQLDVVDADHLNVLATASATIDVASNTAAAGASKRVLCIGDSTVNAGQITQRLLDIAALNTSAVQPVLMGTLGSGSNKHEGRGGWTLDNYYQADSVSAVDNPFVTGGGNKFNLATYLSATSQAAPHVVVWHLGINDVFAAVSDAAVNSLMTTWLDQMRRVIGLTVDAAVGSVIESGASIANVVALPIMPIWSQDGFGKDYGNGQTLARYRRNVALAAYRIRQDLGALEGSRVYLLPWNVTVDPRYGFASETVAANSTAAQTIERASNSVHPNAQGYNQMGDALYACVNWLTVKGFI